jgi:hypothetical protein
VLCTVISQRKSTEDGLLTTRAQIAQARLLQPAAAATITRLSMMLNIIEFVEILFKLVNNVVEVAFKLLIDNVELLDNEFILVLMLLLWIDRSCAKSLIKSEAVCI